MANQHIPRPGTGVAYFEPPEKRRSDKAPDYQGFITLEMDYAAGEKLKFGIWEKQTQMGYSLLSIKEDNYSKKKALENNQPREVHPRTYGLNKPAPMHRNIRVEDDDVPF